MKRALWTPELAWSAPIGVVAAVLAMVLAAASPVTAQSLKGSPASLDRQNRVAQQENFTFMDTGARVKHFAEKGWLVPLRPTRDFDLNGVSYPYTRPEVAVFVRRLGAQYRAACGEPLVVTSLTRPASRQPSNASVRSVHPTGMALDIRYSRSRACRQWLERVLLDLEGANVLEATRERFPAHYHVAVFPKQYAAYVDVVESKPAEPASRTARATAEPASRTAMAAYKVREGDSLWTIARSHGTTVQDLRAANKLANSRIFAGQVLELPEGR